MIKIENWSIVEKADNPYQAPELRKQYLRGTVYNHPIKGDGKLVITSSIIKEEDGYIITNSGSIYELGTVDEEYEKLFPDAKNRLIESLRNKNTGEIK
jgi:hypothetical protein